MSDQHEMIPIFLSEQIRAVAFVLQLQSRTLQLPSKGIQCVHPIVANKIPLIVCHRRTTILTPKILFCIVPDE